MLRCAQHDMGEVVFNRASPQLRSRYDHVLQHNGAERVIEFGGLIHV